MNPHFLAFIELGKELATTNSVAWDVPLDAAGSVLNGNEWDITALAGGVTPKHRLRHLGSDTLALEALNSVRVSNGLPARESSAFSKDWQDLIKAAVLEQIFVRRNSSGHVANNVLRPLRVLATCAVGREPWRLSIDDIHRATMIGKSLQASGKLADLIVGLIRVVFDGNHLTDSGPLCPALSVERLKPKASRRAGYLKSQPEIREGLEDRKRAERLPERRAFWELVRIVMTEQPQSFMDELRFAAVRIMILTGFRIGEATLLPAEWRVDRHYFDSRMRPAGQLGGFAKSLMIRHFAEKQQISGSSGTILVSGIHYVPEMFEEVVSETLSRVEVITSALRRMLRMQSEAGRIFPEFSADDLMPITQAYVRLTGNTFWLEVDETLKRKWIQLCRKDYSSVVFDEIQGKQALMCSQRQARPSAALQMYFRRIAQSGKDGGDSLTFRDSFDRPIPSGGKLDPSSTFVRTSELEEYVRRAMPSKLPDTESFNLADRKFSSWEFLFLHPKRSLSEERNSGICDISRYFSIGRPDPSMVGFSLGEQRSHETLFMRYGQSDEDRSAVLTSHALRHLQNTELFRLGVADTIISKRFNRRSAVQSYEYDHRSLAEELDQLELPVDVEAALGSKASTVAKLIQVGKATGPIVDAFKKVQKDEGDDAAFEFLKVEADGFHATPYGHCLNSFTVDPCPKHLECFSGCRHLSATNLPENRERLRSLELKLIAAIETAEARPSKSVGRTNQIEHATVRLAGVRALLMTPVGAKPFPDGPDLSRPHRKGVMDEQ